MLYETRQFYIEFNPIDYETMQHLINDAASILFDQTGCTLNQFELSVGRLHNNAELHYLRTLVTVPMGTKCEFFI